MDFKPQQGERILLLAQRIRRLMSKGYRKQVMQLKTPWALFKLGLDVSDINPNPTFAEACVALAEAKKGGR